MPQDEDDGFNDFLDEEEECDTLQAQELASLQRKMKTVGIRDGIEFGKQDTLQIGFDHGFEVATSKSFAMGALRGALSTAMACKLVSSEEVEREIQNCIDALHKLHRPDEASDNAVDSQFALVQVQAAELLQRIGLKAPATTKSIQ